MDVIATLKVNDAGTGELLAKVEGAFTCDECKDFDAFYDKHADEIEEFLLNEVHPDCLTGNYLTRLNMLELSDEFAEVV